MFVFLLLEDETELANVVVNPRVHARFPELVRLEPLLIIHGLLERKDGVTNVIAQRFEWSQVSTELEAPEAQNFH